MEFMTPSAAVNNQKCKPNVTHCGTQYLIKDFASQNIKKVEIDKVVNLKPKAPKALEKAQIKSKPKRVSL
jgi:hypothetical protein